MGIFKPPTSYITGAFHGPENFWCKVTVYHPVGSYNTLIVIMWSSRSTSEVVKAHTLLFAFQYNTES